MKTATAPDPSRTRARVLLASVFGQERPQKREVTELADDAPIGVAHQYRAMGLASGRKPFLAGLERVERLGQGRCAVDDGIFGEGQH